VEKYCTAGQGTDDNIVRCMYFACFFNLGYKRTLRIRNTYCFSAATVVTRTRLNVTLYVHCPPCLKMEAECSFQMLVLFYDIPDSK